MFSLTPDSINALAKLALSDPAASAALAKDWRKFVSNHFDLNSLQKKSLTVASVLPSDRVKAIQEAIAAVVKSGGTIKVKSVNKSTGLLEIKPAAQAKSKFSCTVKFGDASCNVTVG